MTLHLLRIDPDPAASARWFAGEGLLPRGEDDGYAWHALLSAAFGKAQAPKPFRVMARRGRPPQLLAYATGEPEGLAAIARDFADPLAIQALGLAERPLSAKPMPLFEAGRRLGFSLRIRPTLRTDSGGDRRKTDEIDAFAAASRKATAAGHAPPDRKEVYAEWTRAKLAAGGAAVRDLRFDGLESVPVVRRDAKRSLREVGGHSASVAGLLEVADPAAFAALLARGVGRHRAFGYGMLLLSPP